jgi:hypothetical protein
MPRPGERRATYLRDHVSRIDAVSADFFASGDSKHSHQQYTDFMRSKKTRSADVLVTCMDCHTPHRDIEQAADLRFAPNDDGACRACHDQPTDIHVHADMTVGFAHQQGVDQDELSCARCHMVKTAAGGARPLALIDISPASNVVEYTRGDRTSHRFVFVSADARATQPVAATDECGFCHIETLSN